MAEIPGAASIAEQSAFLEAMTKFTNAQIKALENQPDIWEKMLASGISGGIGAAGQIMAQNAQNRAAAERQKAQFNQEKELLDIKRKQQSLAPEQKSGLIGLAKSFSGSAPLNIQTQPGAQSGGGQFDAGALTQRLAQLRQRLANVRRV